MPVLFFFNLYVMQFYLKKFNNSWQSKNSWKAYNFWTNSTVSTFESFLESQNGEKVNAQVISVQWECAKLLRLCLDWYRLFYLVRLMDWLMNVLGCGRCKFPAREGSD